jgi:hypothetical protein
VVWYARSGGFELVKEPIEVSKGVGEQEIRTRDLW